MADIGISETIRPAACPSIQESGRRGGFFIIKWKYDFENGPLPVHDVTPTEVAMAVRIVITMWMILLHESLLIFIVH